MQQKGIFGLGRGAKLSEITEVEVPLCGSKEDWWRYIMRYCKDFRNWPDTIALGGDLGRTEYGWSLCIVERRSATDEELHALGIPDSAENVTTDGAVVGSIELVQVTSERANLICKSVRADCQQFICALVQKIETQKLNAGGVLRRVPMASDDQAEPQADSGAVAEQLTPAEDEDSSLIKILFLAANPADRDHLRLDAEMRDIYLALQQTAFRDRFDITGHGAVRVADLQGYLLHHKPDIVHFSGHGDQASEIVLEDSSGKSQPVPVRALSRLFFVLKDNIRCVVLNACYSEQQAKAIAEHIDCVIGMSKVIGDTAASSFAMAFYQALGYGRSVKTAFDLGCAQIDLENLGEQDTPKLLALNNDPETVVFVHSSSK